MYRIIFYKTVQGIQPVKEFIDELQKNCDRSKDYRIKLSKIYEYIEILRLNGTRAGKKYVKYIRDGLWELRPLKERIFSFIGKKIRLYYYTNFTRRQLKRRGEKLKRHFVIRMIFLKGVRKMSKKKVSPIGDDWGEYKETLLSEEERLQIDVRVNLITELINTRKEMGLTQKELEKISGIKQPVIARLEKGSTDPQLTTIMKLLYAMGKTLKIVNK